MVKRLFGMIACYLHGAHDWVLWLHNHSDHIMIDRRCARCGTRTSP